MQKDIQTQTLIIFNDSVYKLTPNFTIMLWASISQAMDYTLRNNPI